MSNPQVHIVKVDGVKLAYVNDEGSGAPLFTMSSLAQAFGLDPASGFFYSEDLKPHRVKRKLNPKTKKVTCIHIHGVYKMLAWRHPIWEQSFREQFVIFQEETSTNLDKPQEDKSVYNPNEVPGKGTLIVDLIKRMERQDKVIERLVDAVETLQAQTGPSFLDVPRKATQVYASIGTAESNELRRLTHEPVYTHVPGYRSYKELLADHGLTQFINTSAGRVFSRRLAAACNRNDIQYYLVLDAYKMTKRKGAYKPKACAPDTYAINAYPQEIWDVVGKQFAQEMVDNATKKS